MSENGEQPETASAIFKGTLRITLSLIESKQKERAMAKVSPGTQKRYVLKIVDSPVGRLKLVATDEGLAGILWEHDRPHRVRFDIEAEEDDTHPVLVETERSR